MVGKKSGFGRGVTPEDQALWEQMMQGAEPLAGREKHAAVPEPEASEEPEIPAADWLDEASEPPARETLHTTAMEAGHSPVVDRRTLERLRKGKMPIEQRIDLHGLSLVQAQHVLEQQLLAAQSAGRRCVLVITGRGLSGDAALPKGALRQALPGWLNSDRLQHIILAFAQSRPEHGGEGAFYILLRR